MFELTRGNGSRVGKTFKLYISASESKQAESGIWVKLEEVSVTGNCTPIIARCCGECDL
jgi:hypothetical protein